MENISQIIGMIGLITFTIGIFIVIIREKKSPISYQNNF